MSQPLQFKGAHDTVDSHDFVQVISNGPFEGRLGNINANRLPPPRLELAVDGRNNGAMYPRLDSFLNKGPVV